jgi:hypothetical protein
MKASLLPKTIAPLAETIASTIETLRTTLADIQQVHGELPASTAQECEIVDWAGLLRQIEHLGRATQHLINVADRQKSSLRALKALARRNRGEVRALDRMYSLSRPDAVTPA